MSASHRQRGQLEPLLLCKSDTEHPMSWGAVLLTRRDGFIASEEVRADISTVHGLACAATVAHERFCTQDSAESVFSDRLGSRSRKGAWHGASQRRLVRLALLPLPMSNFGRQIPPSAPPLRLGSLVVIGEESQGKQLSGNSCRSLPLLHALDSYHRGSPLRALSLTRGISGLRVRKRRLLSPRQRVRFVLLPYAMDSCRCRAPRRASHLVPRDTETALEKLEAITSMATCAARVAALCAGFTSPQVVTESAVFHKFGTSHIRHPRLLATSLHSLPFETSLPPSLPIFFSSHPLLHQITNATSTSEH